MPRITTESVNALVKCLTNDGQGKISYTDEKRIIAGGMADIAKATDPQKAYESGMRVIAAARQLLGTGSRAGETLDRFKSQGKDAVTLRLEQLSGTSQLPLDVRERFEEIVKWSPIGSTAPVRFSNVQRDSAGAYAFDYDLGTQKGTGYAVRMDGQWVLAPRKITKAESDAATESMKAYFDDSIAPDLVASGVTATEAAGMRAAIAVSQVFFPFEDSDPYNLVGTYPLVFVLTNPTGSDHGYFVGLDPSTGRTEAYDFN